MFLDPEPKTAKLHVSSSPFFAAQMPAERAGDQRWRKRRSALSERTSSQINQRSPDKTPALKPGPATVRLVRHSPTSSLQLEQDENIIPCRDSADFDTGSVTVRVAKRVSLQRYKSSPAPRLARRAAPLVLVQEASARNELSSDDRVSASHNLPYDTPPKLHIPPSTARLPNELPRSAWHRRDASSGKYSNTSTLRDHDSSLIAHSIVTSRLSGSTTLRGTPTPYEQEHPKHSDIDEPQQGPAYALEILQETVPAQPSVRAILPSVESSPPVSRLPSVASETSLPRSSTVSFPSELEFDSEAQLSSPRRYSADRVTPLPTSFTRTDSSLRTPRHQVSREAISPLSSTLPEASSPIFILYGSDSSRPRSRSQPLRYSPSIESIHSRLQYPSTTRPETGGSHVRTGSWSSPNPSSSVDTLAPLHVIRKRSREINRPESPTQGAPRASSNEMEEDYDTSPYPRQQFNSHLSTIASESDQMSRSGSRQLSHFSLGSGVLTGDDASSIPPHGNRGRRGSAPVESMSSYKVIAGGGNGSDEPGDMTLGIFREESAKPEPLFEPKTQRSASGARKYDGPLPPIPPIPQERDEEENWDTVSELHTPALRAKRSGYSLRNRSNSTPSRSGSHSRQISTISYVDSDRDSHGSSIFPLWAKNFYGGGVALLSSSNISMGGSYRTPQDPQRQAHARTGSQWTERSITSRLGTGYSEIQTESPISSHFLPSIFRPRTRTRSEGNTHMSHPRRSKRSRPSADTESRPDSMAISTEPFPRLSTNDNSVLPSGQPKFGKLKDGSEKQDPQRLHRPLPRKYSKQKHWDGMEYPRPMTKDRLSDFAFEENPTLRPSKRHQNGNNNNNKLSSGWRPPSFVDSLDTLVRSRCNRQVLFFALGFVCPLLWMLAAVLPLPPRPGNLHDLEKSGGVGVGGSEEDVQVAMMRHEAGDAERRWREEKQWVKGRWWRALNRVMSLVGLLILAAVIALAVVATRKNSSLS
ncbi:hypothetical protein LTR62_007800 [Meristemomyces frigidus]|uniref:Serine-rich protein n=1 Tax=Meristemomyces frigidus TaxID=1508187 RepID=A0AAN7TE73_9PEZI|nr:hypothetical protein LTR62_007800 [Meristemomyces frigidus]